jgi:hypothetical protein
MASRSFRLIILAMAALCGRIAPAAAAGPVTTRFEMFGFAGLHVLTMRSRTDERAGGYAVSLEYSTSGLAKLFVDMTSLSDVTGRIVDGVAQPNWFESDSVRDGTARHSRIDYHSDGIVDVAANPPPADPISPKRMRGTVDNLTAYFRLEHQLAETGSCNLTVHVFDGRHAYDLVFSDAGRQQLEPEGGQNFSGKKIVCRMVRRKWPGVVDPEQDEGAKDGTIWYARLVPGDLLVPVRTRMNTQLGVVTGYLAELHGRGVNLDLLH